MSQLLARLLVGLGYTFAGVGAILTPIAYAFDRLDTLPAIGIALALIAAGVGIVLAGDKIGDGGAVQPLSDPLETSSNR